MSGDFSKTLKNNDDSAGRIIKNVLGGRMGYGIDIEIIFKTKSSGWVIMELLKCESCYVTPCTSHPKRYWNKNWRKFVRLWEIAKKLDSCLFLVNYDEPTENSYKEFRIMEVDMMVEPSEEKIIETKDIIKKGTFEDFQKWYLGINNDHEKM